MRTATVLEAFKHNTHAIADKLGITRQAVEQWGEIVPIHSAMKLQEMSKGVLQVETALYTKRRKRA